MAEDRISKGQAALLQWAQENTDHVPGVSLTGFEPESWRDGLAFVALINKWRPDLISRETIDENDAEANIELAFDVGEAELEVEAYLDEDDLESWEATEITAYVSQLYMAFKDATPVAVGDDENGSSSSSSSSSSTSSASSASDASGASDHAANVEPAVETADPNASPALPDGAGGDDEWKNRERKAGVTTGAGWGAERSWEDQQGKTFKRWCNVYLRELGREVNDLAADFASGLNLVYLVGILSGDEALSSRANLKCRFRVQKLENINLALNRLAELGIDTSAIGAEDIADGVVKMILSLLFKLIQHFELNELFGGGDYKEELMAWVTARTAAYPGARVTNWTTSWANGLAFLALAASCGATVDYDAAAGDDTSDEDRLEAAFAVAGNDLFIPRLLDARDFIENETIDDKSVLLFVSQFHRVVEGKSREVNVSADAIAAASAAVEEDSAVDGHDRLRRAEEARQAVNASEAAVGEWDGSAARVTDGHEVLAKAEAARKAMAVADAPEGEWKASDTDGSELLRKAEEARQRSAANSTLNRPKEEWARQRTDSMERRAPKAASGWTIADKSWEAAQVFAFTAWANAVLAGRGVVVNDIATDFADGVALLHLVEAVAGDDGVVASGTAAPKFQVQKMENLANALAFAQDQGVILTGIGSSDFADGNVKLIAACLWRLIEHYEINAKCGGSDALLAWVQEFVSNHPVNVPSFASLADGVALGALLHAADPECIDFGALKAGDTAGNMPTVLAVAEARFGVPALLRVADLQAAPKPDHRSIMTYVALVRQELAGVVPQVPEGLSEPEAAIAAAERAIADAEVAVASAEFNKAEALQEQTEFFETEAEIREQQRAAAAAATADPVPAAAVNEMDVLNSLTDELDGMAAQAAAEAEAEAAAAAERLRLEQEAAAAEDARRRAEARAAADAKAAADARAAAAAADAAADAAERERLEQERLAAAQASEEERVQAERERLEREAAAAQAAEEERVRAEEERLEREAAEKAAEEAERKRVEQQRAEEEERERARQEADARAAAEEQARREAEATAAAQAAAAAQAEAEARANEARIKEELRRERERLLQEEKTAKAAQEVRAARAVVKRARADSVSAQEARAQVEIDSVDVTSSQQRAEKETEGALLEMRRAMAETKAAQDDQTTIEERINMRAARNVFAGGAGATTSATATAARQPARRSAGKNKSPARKYGGATVSPMAPSTVTSFFSKLDAQKKNTGS